MEFRVSKAKYITSATLLALGFIYNSLGIASPVFGTLLTITFFVFTSHVLGIIIFNHRGWHWLIGFLATITLLGVATALLVAFDILIPQLIVGILLLLLIAPYWLYFSRVHHGIIATLRHLFSKHTSVFLERRESKFNSVLVVLYITGWIVTAYCIWTGQTTSSIQSPWQTVFPLTLFSYFGTTLLLIWYCYRARHIKLPIGLLIAHTGLSVSIAQIIYSLGFGYDPFIHQATERIIAETGRIEPTPPYYLGQYGLVVMLHHISLLSIKLIDSWLVPVLTALLLPTTTYFAFSKWLSHNKALLLSISILLLPLGGFIMTTPQNLANLFVIVTSLVSLLYFQGYLKLWFIAGLTLLTIAIHPLAGVPLLITIGLFALFKWQFAVYHKHIGLYILSSVVFVLTMPVLLLVTKVATGWKMPTLNALIPSLRTPRSYADPLLDIVYWIQAYDWIIVLIFIAIGIIFLYRNNLLRRNTPIIVAALVIFGNYVLTKLFLEFDALNANDSAPFVERLRLLSLYIILPIALLGIIKVITYFNRIGWIGKVAMALSLAAGITMSVYIAYPRLDRYEPSSFYSISTADTAAVKYIEHQAHPEHVVLANQMIAAAAIQEVGFKKYIGPQYFYSVPMGEIGTLHKAYLAMVYEGTQRSTIDEIFSETNVEEVYFVLNSYWHNAAQIREQAAMYADSVTSIEDGTVYIFKYSK